MPSRPQHRSPHPRGGVPTVVLSDLLGVGVSTAERWRQYAGGSRTTYAPAGGCSPVTDASDKPGS